MNFIFNVVLGFCLGWLVGRMFRLLKNRNALDTTIVPEEVITDEEPTTMA